jgi:hypothetical protein
MVTDLEGYPTLVRLFMRYDGLPRRPKFAKDWGMTSGTLGALAHDQPDRVHLRHSPL